MKNLFKLFVVALLAIVSFASCETANNEGGVPTIEIVEVKSSDNSITFAVTATNATECAYLLYDGDIVSASDVFENGTQTAASGVVEVKNLKAKTTYYVVAAARNANGEALSNTLKITTTGAGNNNGGNDDEKDDDEKEDIHVEDYIPEEYAELFKQSNEYQGITINLKVHACGHLIFDGDIRISLWGYNIETVIAEKVETILRRGVFTTRPRDYYDVYILGTTQEYDKEIYKEALKATAEHRGSTEQISDVEGILKQISESDDLKDMWRKYQKKFAYASDISYEDVLEVLRKIVL